MSEQVITLDDVTFSYPGTPFRLAVHELHLAQGERVALIGPSGSGKSTLLDLVAGISTPSSGSVITAGRDMCTSSRAERMMHRLANIGFVFQEFRLLDYLRVIESIMLPARLAGMRIDNAFRSRVGELASRAGIEHLLARRPDRLSHGERQRAAICRALASGPRLVLADEPTGNLDPATSTAILDLLFEQLEQSGAAMLMVTHERDILDRFDRVIDLGAEGGST